MDTTRVRSSKAGLKRANTFRKEQGKHLIQESELDCKKGTVAQPGLLTVREAARYLAVSVSTLYGWVWQRRVPFVKIGRALRFDPRDLEAFVEASKQHPSGSRTLRCYNKRAAGKG